MASAMSRPELRQPDLFAESLSEFDIWTERLLAAFDDANLRSGFLPLAENAIAAFPGGATRLPWLRRQLDSIIGTDDRFRDWRVAARPKVKPKSVTKSVP